MLQPSCYTGYIAISQHLHSHPHHQNNLSTKNYRFVLAKMQINSKTLSAYLSNTNSIWLVRIGFVLPYIYFVMGTNVSNISEKLFLQNFFRAICLFLHFITKVAKNKFRLLRIFQNELVARYLGVIWPAGNVFHCWLI